MNAIAWLSCILSVLLSWGCATGVTVKPDEPKHMVRSMETGKLPLSDNPLDAAYWVDGRVVQLHHGKVSQPAAPGASAFIEILVSGDPEYGDLNGDGLDDAVLFLQCNTGGSGTFYYAAVCLYNGLRWRGTSAVFLGDRIIPQRIDINNGIVIVHYLRRMPDEPMSASAKVEMSKTLALEAFADH